MSTDRKLSDITDQGLPARAWQRMLSGKRLDLLSPAPEDIDVSDIAHGLARVARWNGQTYGPNAFSVAQHSLMVEMVCAFENPEWDRKWSRAALLHDAAEYVIGDLISPFKAVIGNGYKKIELGILKAVHIHFSLPEILPDKIRIGIKEADRLCAYFEATRLAGFNDNEAIRYFGSPEGIAPELYERLSGLEPLSTEDAERAFLERIEQLME